MAKDAGIKRTDAPGIGTSVLQAPGHGLYDVDLGLFFVINYSANAAHLVVLSTEDKIILFFLTFELLYESDL